MPNPCTTSENTRQPDGEPQSDTMRDADIANGENPDPGGWGGTDSVRDDPAPDDPVHDDPVHDDTAARTHRTGVRQARENAEKDPPA